MFTLTFGILSLASFAQTDDGRTMTPILKTAEPLIENIEGKGYEIVRMELDILSDLKESYRYLYDGWTYGILAFGDYRIEDIDIEVYKSIDDEWVQVGKDSDASSAALVNITPVTTGLYKIVVRGYKFAEGSTVGHYGLLIFHE